MKANEAPEKIYMTPSFGEPDNVLLASFSKSHLNYHIDIEYTRTDAFIEKALKWYCLDCECNDNCKDSKCFFHNEYKRFLEGNKNACPPKFELTILNPDGSTSDNWRYRHFTRKMQDAFVEKAVEYIITHIPDMHTLGISAKTDECIIEDFRAYIKGE